MFCLYGNHDVWVTQTHARYLSHPRVGPVIDDVPYLKLVGHLTSIIARHSFCTIVNLKRAVRDLGRTARSFQCRPI